MAAYKHYSFDLWMTLIKSNPAFKRQRAAFFYNNFNQAGKSLEEVGAIFKRVDVMCNAINEKTGGSISSEEMYLMVVSAMNDYSNAFEGIDLEGLYTEMEQLLFKHPPVVYCGNTAHVLGKIKRQEGVTLSLLSNTAFIKGRTLREVLKRIDLHRFFDFQLYSDETGVSKPSLQFFNIMLGNVAEARKGAAIHASEIVHVGDNITADFYGAQAAGISSILVNSNNVSITSLISS